jgi:prepilin-type N-terminal cleavage/methylation domain-containing protein
MRIQRGARGFTFLEVAVAAAILTVILLVAMQGTATTEVTVNDTNDRIIAQNAANNVMQFLLECLWIDDYDSATTTLTYPDPGSTNALDGYGPGILNYLHGTVKLTPGGSAVPGTLNTFSVPVPGYFANNNLGTFWVVEANATECPGYGGAPRYNGSPVSYGIPLSLFPTGTSAKTLPLVPYSRSVSTSCPTLLQIIVQVNIPPFVGSYNVATNTWSYPATSPYQTPYPGMSPPSAGAYQGQRTTTLVQLQSLRSSL